MTRKKYPKVRVDEQFQKELDRMNMNLNEMFKSNRIKKVSSRTDATKLIANMMPQIEINSVERKGKKRMVEVRTLLRM